MEYLARVQRAIDYIEAHLQDSVELTDVADAAAFSPFHFHRIFGSTVGESVGEYIRKRRLSEAAIALRSTPRRIIEIAMHYQFESQEAFTRAFKKLFHVTPLEYRNLTQHPTFYEKKVITEEVIMHRNNNIEVKSELIFREEFWVVGLEYIGPIKHQGTHWHEFMKLSGKIKYRTDFSTAYGVCFSDREMVKKGEVNYLAAFPVTEPKDVPQGLVARKIPAGHYAVVTHHGPISKILVTVEHVFKNWLPKSGYEPDNRPDLEFYDERFKMENEDSQLDLWVPVKPTK